MFVLMLVLLIDDATIKAIELSGGTVVVVGKSPLVTLKNTTDKQLQSFDLMDSKGGYISLRSTFVSDTGLQALKGTGFSRLAIGNGNKWLTLDGIVHVISHMPELKELSLYGPNGDWRKLSDVKRLEHLGLIGPTYTDDDIDGLTKLHSLKRLTLAVTKITEKGLERLKEALPKTEITVLPKAPEGQLLVGPLDPNMRASQSPTRTDSNPVDILEGWLQLWRLRCLA